MATRDKDARGTAPIVAPAAWQAAVDAADGQCEGRKRDERCTRTLRAGYRLFLDSDGHVYCVDHHAPKRQSSKPYIVMTGTDPQERLF